jgi:hypothetical protein
MKQADNILDHIDDLVTAMQKVEKRTQSTTFLCSRCFTPITELNTK